ncbi:hypothetical protein M098_4437 [Phocaeicola vulgatus str. 3775 SR(B) 19]|nr:hypothetical protein M098_4437 [Phocaeicola vulgatus str. 3775 SR(B) 19]
MCSIVETLNGFVYILLSSFAMNIAQTKFIHGFWNRIYGLFKTLKSSFIAFVPIPSL